MGRGFTALSAGALVAMMLAVLALAYAKPEETESTPGHNRSVVGI